MTGRGGTSGWLPGVIVIVALGVGGLVVWGAVAVLHLGQAAKGADVASPAGSSSSGTAGGGFTPAGSSAAADAPGQAGGGSAPAAPIGRFRCPAATLTVSTADQLTQALASAATGEVIGLQDGVYSGSFEATTSGTAGAPVYLCGGRGAVVQGHSIATGYALHLQHVAHWRISGFTVREAQKGVVLDQSTDVALQDLLVEHIGDEGVHLRTDSSGDVVRGLTIQDTGRLKATFGEGIYVGTARSNWNSVTGGEPDRSDHDYLLENSISRTTAESVDIKEGTTAGVIAANRFDGTGMTAATGLVNVKGNAWVISGNSGVNTPQDGYQTHVVLAGWGEHNVFTGNQADLSTSQGGVGIWVQGSLGNLVSCSNTTTGGRMSNISCTRS